MSADIVKCPLDGQVTLVEKPLAWKFPWSAAMHRSEKAALKLLEVISLNYVECLIKGWAGCTRPAGERPW